MVRAGKWSWRTRPTLVGPSGGMVEGMSGIRARVQNGRLLVDVPPGPPEGTVIDLVVDDEGDELRPRVCEAHGRSSLRRHGGRSESGVDEVRAPRKKGFTTEHIRMFHEFACSVGVPDATRS